jgi:hypothetical protein
MLLGMPQKRKSAVTRMKGTRYSFLKSLPEWLAEWEFSMKIILEMNELKLLQVIQRYNF